MYVITFLGLLAFVSAAPQFYNHGSYSSELGSLERLLDDEIFSMRNLWTQLRKDMFTLEDSLLDMSRRIAITAPTEKIEGSNYKIVMSVPDFEEKDITVKIGNGMLQIDAQKYTTPGVMKQYIYIKNLPDTVSETGTWEFENNILTVTLPLKNVDSTVLTDTDNKFGDREHSREELDEDTTDNNINADVGIETTIQPELLTNEIPEAKVEATTYSEINNDIEFVPVRYRRK